MGLFDKIKHFAGGHGVSVTITRVERQDPASVTFPLTDSVMKFNVEITSEKEVTVLKHEFEVYAEREDEENPRLIQVAEDVHDESTEIYGADISWPYDIKPGQVVKDGCVISDVDIGGTLREMGVDNPTTVLDDPRYRFFVKFTADVKGSPMDPEAEVDIKVVV